MTDIPSKHGAFEHPAYAIVREIERCWSGSDDQASNRADMIVMGLGRAGHLSVASVGADHVRLGGYSVGSDWQNAADSRAVEIEIMKELQAAVKNAGLRPS